VSVRLRPLKSKEKEKGSVWEIQGNRIKTFGAAPAGDGPGYTLDNVFGPEWSTEQVYQHTAQHLIRKVVKGFNATVFAYGQTSSGKTHTMRGTQSEPGLVPMGVKEVFDLIAACTSREFLVRVSYMEVE
jgi:centromeric protein E